MALTFPRIMPEFGIMEAPFDIERVDYLSPEAGGRLGAMTAGFPLWHMMLQLQNMTIRDGDDWAAWVDSLRGAQRLFYAYDVKRRVPRFHANGLPFTRKPSGWSQTIDAAGNAVLTLQGVMTGMVLSKRDYIGFEWGETKRSLVRVVEGGAGDTSNSLVVTVEPPVPPITPSDASVNLHRPTCLMRLVAQETKLQSSGLGGYYPAGGMVGGIQELVA